MTFDEYMALVNKTYKQHIHDGINAWRYGQTASNVLKQVRPDIADELIGGTVDCFYQDGYTHVYLQTVAERWDK